MYEMEGEVIVTRERGVDGVSLLDMRDTSGGENGFSERAGSNLKT